MPLFDFECKNCRKVVEDKFFRKDPPNSMQCPICGHPAYRIFSLGRGVRSGESRTIYSRSMGVHPNQIAEMERLHPGRKYAPDGRLEVNGFEHQKKLAKEHNMVID